MEKIYSFLDAHKLLSFSVSMLGMLLPFAILINIVSLITVFPANVVTDFLGIVCLVDILIALPVFVYCCPIVEKEVEDYIKDNPDLYKDKF